MQSYRNKYGFERHCWAEIDLDALRDNFAYVHRTAGRPVCAVVKADAYGHGAVAVARALHGAGVAGFAVSCLGEARHLRRHGITLPILVLGYTDPAFAAGLANQGITQAVFSPEYARALSAAAVAAGVSVSCHLKVDTGMGRIGFAVRGNYAVADSTGADDAAYTAGQQALFARTVEAVRAAGYAPGVVHSANSAAQLCHPEWNGDMTRAGIVLYGLAPSPELPFPALRPVMTLKAVITQVKMLQPGESVSYGRRYTAETPRRVATVSVGYADGYPRRLSGNDAGGVMLVRGQAAPVLGRVCMDQTVIDVTDIPAAMGDEVTGFGPAGAEAGADTADTIAQKTGTINYEVVCGISRRVPRVYLQGGALVGIWNDLEEG